MNESIKFFLGLFLLAVFIWLVFFLGERMYLNQVKETMPLGSVANDAVAVNPATDAGKITTSFLGTGTVFNCRVAELEHTGLSGQTGTGLPIAKIGTEDGGYLYAVLDSPDITDGTNVEIVGVYHGKTRIAIVARRRVGWNKPSP